MHENSTLHASTITLQNGSLSSFKSIHKAERNIFYPLFNNSGRESP